MRGITRPTTVRVRADSRHSALIVRADMNLPASFLSRRSLLVAEGAQRLGKLNFGKNLPQKPPERAVLHALTLQTLFVDYLKEKNPNNWTFQERIYIVHLLEAYDAVVTLVEDENVREFLREMMAQPLDSQKSKLF